MTVRLGLALLCLVAASCSPAGGTPGTDTAAPVSLAPAGDETWRTAMLTDVLTNTEFRIDDLRGNVVVLETMAVWCTTCRIQQGEAQAALQQLNRPEVVYISLDVDPNERPEELADYARRQGYGWRFAVSSPGVSRSLAAEFGEQVLSPPATPLVILDQEGQLIEKHVGIKSASDLVALLSENLQ